MPTARLVPLKLSGLQVFGRRYEICLPRETGSSQDAQRGRDVENSELVTEVEQWLKDVSAGDRGRSELPAGIVARLR